MGLRRVRLHPRRRRSSGRMPGVRFAQGPVQSNVMPARVCMTSPSALLSVLDSHSVQRRHFLSFSEGFGQVRLCFKITQPVVDHWFHQDVGSGSWSHYRDALKEALQRVHPDLQVKAIRSKQGAESHLSFVEVFCQSPEGIRLLRQTHEEIQRRNAHWGHRLWNWFQGILDA